MSRVRGWLLGCVLVLLGCQSEQTADVAEPSKSVPAALPLPRNARQQAAANDQPRSFVNEPREVRFRENRFFRQQDLFLPADEPATVAAEAAESLAPSDEVLGLTLGGMARAYPVRALCYHHVVNDRLGAQPVVVTYCVICSSGIAFDPVVDERRLTFGFHGIWQGTAVLYDRETGSHWLHLSGECVEGPLQGKRLRSIAGTHATWREWRRAHPQTEVMAEDPDFRDRYFPRASAARGLEFFPAGFLKTIQTRDHRLPLSQLCLGVRVGASVKAYPYSELSKLEFGLVEDVLDGQGILIVHERDTGTTRALLREHAGGRLTFAASADEDALRETTTGSRFSRHGGALDGPLLGVQLPLVDSLQAEWYGWFAVYPHTELFAVGAE